MSQLVICYHSCPTDEPGTDLSGGISTFLRGLLPCLGEPVTVLSWGRQFQVLPMGEGVSVVRLPCCSDPSPWTRAQAWECLPRFVDLAREWLQGRTFTAVSAHYWMSMVAARDLGLERVSVMYHTLQALRGSAPDELGALRARLEFELAEWAHQVVFLSALDLGRSRPYLAPCRTARLRVGLDPSFCPGSRAAARSRLGLPESARLFGMAARNEPAKNVGAAVAAISALPGAALLLAGQAGPDSDTVRYLGSLPHAQMPGFYQAVEAVLCPSEYESFGLVCLEALGCGLPVVVSPGGYWARAFRATGAGLVATPAELPQVCARLYRSPELRAELGARARSLALRFSWERCGEAWNRLLR